MINQRLIALLHIGQVLLTFDQLLIHSKQNSWLQSRVYPPATELKHIMHSTSFIGISSKSSIISLRLYE